MHDFTASLAHLRATTPALQGGGQQTVLVGQDTCAYVRMPRNASTACSAGVSVPSVLVAVNRSGQANTLTLPKDGNALAGCSRATQVFGDAAQVNGWNVTLQAMGFAVFRLE